VTFAVRFEGLSVWQAAHIIEAARAACCPVTIDGPTLLAIRAIGKSARSVPRSDHGARAVASTSGDRVPGARAA
jgi:hypothetical protein